jgi:integrase
VFEVLRHVDARNDLRPALLAVLCGLRRSEIAALRWRNVDLTTGQLSIDASAEQMNGSVRIKETKSGRARTVAMSETVRADCAPITPGRRRT